MEITAHPPLVRRRTALAGLLAAAALAVAACGSGGAAPDSGPARLVVGSTPALTNAGLYHAVASGAFTRRGLAVEPSVMQSGAAAVPLLLNGQLQLTAIDPAAVIVALGRGLPLRIVAPANIVPRDASADSSGLLVAAGGPIASPADLTGRTVAVNALSGVGDVAVRRLIDASGGDSSATRFLEMPFPQMAEAVARGDVDAAAVNEPFLTQGLSAGLRNLGELLSATVPGIPLAVYVTSAEYLAEQPAAVAAFAAAIAEANAHLGAHPDQVRAVGRTSTQTPPAVLDRVVLPVFDGAPVDPAALAGLQELMVGYGMLPAGVDVGSALVRGAP